MICLAAAAKRRDLPAKMASAVRVAAGDEVGQAGQLPQIISLKDLEAKSSEALGEEEEDQEALFEEEIEVLEEELVQVEINGIFQDLFKPAAHSRDRKGSVKGGPQDQDLRAKFVGLDTQQPIVQIGNQVFAGTYEHTLGTSIFFTLEHTSPATASSGESSSDQSADHRKVFDNSPADKRVEYACKANKKLVLKRVFLTPK